MRRRDLLIAGAVVTGLVAAPKAARLFRPEFTFEPLPGLPGFRQVAVDFAPASEPFMLALEPTPPARAHLRDVIRQAPCGVLFDPAVPGDARVPVAAFTDSFCAYCPAASRQLRALAQSGALVRITWHDLPILGPRSEQAARVARAAALQGKYDAVHSYLFQGGLRPGPAALAALAARFGLDAERLARDIAGEAVQNSLDRTQALADVLGIFGTPALMVGRTLVIGRMDSRRLSRLIALEGETVPC